MQSGTYLTIARSAVAPAARLMRPAVAEPALPNQGMQLSEQGLSLIKSFEGCLKKRPDGTLEAYRCPAGVWTIGWGCTEGVREGMIISVAEASRLLARELGHFEIVVGRLVKVRLTQGEFDALVSFVYNVGEGAFARSTLLRQLNAGNYASVPAQLLRFTRGGGRVLPGLVRRRKAEAALFLASTIGGATLGDDYGPMPQQVEATTGSATKVVTSSRTFWGAIVAALGWGGSKLHDTFGLLGDAAQQARSSSDGVLSLLALLHINAETVGIAVGLVGLAAVLFARFEANREGKVG